MIKILLAIFPVLLVLAASALASLVLSPVRYVRGFWRPAAAAA
ncbi:hypothetical protein [Methylobacterium gregans]|nr:hypothetical protein [Methylobacterium gregans]MDQ0524282.1 hypothetical protein [Methylobacterium gregans]